MTHHPGWYPPGQVSSPPELPAYLKNVYELKPITGVPGDEQVLGIHAVVHAARKASEVPGMHNPRLLMSLADHLFSAQMARYRSKYSLITFPSDATHTPPVLPIHVSVNLESVSGAPSDEEILKVQDAVRSYQRFESVPSMFDQRVSMELSQHLFDLQMARHMRLAGETLPISGCDDREKPASSTRAMDPNTVTAEESRVGTNNAGKGESTPTTDIASQLVPAIDIHEQLERSNQISERFNQVIEQFTRAIERMSEPSQHSAQLSERFNQLLERFSLLMEQSNQLAQPSIESSRFTQSVEQSTEQSNRLAERFNQLLERSNDLISQLVQPLQRSNELSERANELAERLNQLTERSDSPAEGANISVDRLEDVMKNINRVLVGIQHAIVRNRKDNKASAADCLVNEKGETPASSKITYRRSYAWLKQEFECGNNLPVTINGASLGLYVRDSWLAEFLRFYGIWEGLCKDGTSTAVIDGKEGEARRRLSGYLSSCLG